MALELFGGAVLGVLFDRLQKEIWRVKDNFVMFKSKLEELEETLTVLYPVIKEIEELNRRLNRPNHGKETIILRRLLEDGTDLVSKCSKISRWNIFKQRRYRGKLEELDNKILRFHYLYSQAHMGRDQKQTLLSVQETRQMMIMSLNQQGLSNLTMGFTDSSDLSTASSTGSSNITISISTFGESNTSGSLCDAFDVLKGSIPCASVAEKNLLADTAKILENNKFHTDTPKEDLRKIVTVDLSVLGYDCYICSLKKWDKTLSYPAGEYEYIEVILESERLFIDIDFLSEFEIARSTGAYRGVLQLLPLIFVGKSDRLSQIISIASEAAKQSLKKKGIHFPPWRKAEYIQAKWLSSTYILGPRKPRDRGGGGVVVEETALGGGR
ncbi:hypothetical protein K1719_038057 [Acacia pycnantha]|nr:hypothetical protein K1719_038057 [Acacia pycnantha]